MTRAIWAATAVLLLIAVGAAYAATGSLRAGLLAALVLTAVAKIADTVIARHERAAAEGAS